MTKVINLFGGPGSGKSTLASGIFYNLKLKGVKVELCAEWIKDKVYEGTPYPFKDQLYTLAKQHKKIRQLNGKVDYIICDSPIIQGLIYENGEPPLFKDMVLQYFNMYENINILLKRDAKYETFGRSQTEEEADDLAKKIEVLLKFYNIKYTVLPTRQAIDNIDNILELSEKLGGK